MNRNITLSLICLLSLFSAAHGQNIYKSVDEDGNISYSSVKPDNAGETEIIESPREPSPEEVEAARIRQQKLDDTVAEIRSRREEQKLEEELQQALKKQGSRTDVQQQTLPVPVLRDRVVPGPVPRPRPLPTVRPAAPVF